MSTMLEGAFFCDSPVPNKWKGGTWNSAVPRKEHWPDFPAERAAPLPATLQALQILTKTLFCCSPFAECESTQGMFGGAQWVEYVPEHWIPRVNQDHPGPFQILSRSLSPMRFW